MKLLICTQKVDKNDPILGFFHRWIEEFATRCEQVIVVCLEEGAHSLPTNVRVLSLGKPYSAPDSAKATTGKKATKGEGARLLSRVTYAMRFRKLIKDNVSGYDAVFVHMNPEYVVLGGRFWKRHGKQVSLWYVHKSVTPWLRLALRLVDVVFTASAGSFRLKSPKVRVVGHGIDTDFFSPVPRQPSHELGILSIGRLDPSKRHDLIIRACALLQKPFILTIVGPGQERAALEKLAQDLHIEQKVKFLGARTQEQVRDLYRQSDFFVHASETGSLDKVVLEALATDLPVITTAGEIFKEFSVYRVSATPEAIAEALQTEREPFDRARIIREKHSLTRLIERIVSLLS